MPGGRPTAAEGEGASREISAEDLKAKHSNTCRADTRYRAQGPGACCLVHEERRLARVHARRGQDPPPSRSRAPSSIHAANLACAGWPMSLKPAWAAEWVGASGLGSSGPPALPVSSSLEFSPSRAHTPAPACTCSWPASTQGAGRGEGVLEVEGERGRKQAGGGAATCWRTAANKEIFSQDTWCTRRREPCALSSSVHSPPLSTTSSRPAAPANDGPAGRPPPPIR